jgi:hypothetical protein
VTDWKAFYQSIELTPEEVEEAIFEGKKKKHFHEKNKEYWQEQEHGNSKPTPKSICAGTDGEVKKP